MSLRAVMFCWREGGHFFSAVVTLHPFWYCCATLWQTQCYECFLLNKSKRYHNITLCGCGNGTTVYTCWLHSLSKQKTYNKFTMTILNHDCRSGWNAPNTVRPFSGWNWWSENKRTSYREWTSQHCVSMWHNWKTFHWKGGGALMHGWNM